MTNNNPLFQQRPDKALGTLFPGYLILLEAASRRRERLAKQQSSKQHDEDAAENPHLGVKHDH